MIKVGETDSLNYSNYDYRIDLEGKNLYLVTGGSRGLGRAVCSAILKKDDKAYVLLGSRNIGRGNESIKLIVQSTPNHDKRLEVFELDVTDQDSIRRAVRHLKVMLRWVDVPQHAFQCRGPSLLGMTQKMPSIHLPSKLKLYGIVNNAGVGPIQTTSSLQSILEVNYYGVKRVCNSFIPFVIENGVGSIVNVTSSAGPFYVSKCSPETQKFFINPSTTPEALETFIMECSAFKGDVLKFLEYGYGDGNSYALSKACTNLLTLQLAKRYPKLRINSCSPGLIETELTQVLVKQSGIKATDIGMKAPVYGTKVIVQCIFDVGAKDKVHGQAKFYGEDGKRSPFHAYRNEDDPEYDGSVEAKYFCEDGKEGTKKK